MKRPLITGGATLAAVGCAAWLFQRKAASVPAVTEVALSPAEAQWCAVGEISELFGQPTVEQLEAFIRRAFVAAQEGHRDGLMAMDLGFDSLVALSPADFARVLAAYPS